MVLCHFAGKTERNTLSINTSSLLVPIAIGILEDCRSGYNPPIWGIFSIRVASDFLSFTFSPTGQHLLLYGERSSGYL